MRDSGNEFLLGSITSRCSGKEPALLPRKVDQTGEAAKIDPDDAQGLTYLTCHELTKIFLFIQ